MRRLHRKGVVVSLVVLVLGLGGGIAYAYWSQSGSGTGTATTGTTTAITVNQTTSVTGLGPGTAPVALSGTFNNPNASKVYVAGVTATVTGTSAGAACTAANYTITGTSNVPGEIGSGTSQGAWSGLSIAFVDTASNQDACKGVTVNISYTSS